MRYNPQTGKTDVFREATNEANGMMFDQLGQLYACEGGGLCIARYNADGSRDVIVDRFEGKRLNSPNDLAFDDQGRIWFTDPRYGARIDDLELDHQSVLRANPQPDGNWLLDSEFIPKVVGHWFLGSGFCRLGFSEQNHRFACLSTRAV